MKRKYEYTKNFFTLIDQIDLLQGSEQFFNLVYFQNLLQKIKNDLQKIVSQVSKNNPYFLHKFQFLQSIYI